jgi:hypothetical protein
VFLKTQILPLTGLDAGQIETLTSMLGVDAVIYGSSILYAYKNTLNLGGTPIGDIDIAITDTALFDNILDFLTSALTGAERYDNPNIPNYPITDFAALNIGFTKNLLLNYYLQNTTAPPDGNTMGTFNVQAVTDGNGYTNGEIYPLFNKVLNVTTFYFNDNLRIQLVLYDVGTTTAQDEIMQNGDFTAASGVYNGTSLFISSDVAANKTFYRGDQDRRDTLILGKDDWLLYRLDKYIKRGFTIYFANQDLIDLWNSNEFVTSIPDGIKVNFICPFPLKPIDYVQSFIEIT